jgi:pantothenate kinase
MPTLKKEANNLLCTKKSSECRKILVCVCVTLCIYVQLVKKAINEMVVNRLRLHGEVCIMSALISLIML